MPVDAATAPSTSPQRRILPRVTRRDPPFAVLFATVVTVVASLLVAVEARTVRHALNDAPFDVLLWGAIVGVVNLFPVAFGKLRLCLDMPVLMTVAITYEPPVSAALAAIAALDRREFTREISVSNALFNRAQVALSVYVASTVFHRLSPDLQAWHVAIPATAFALVTSYAANVVLVTTYASIQERMGSRGLLTFLKTAAALPFLGTYLGYGLLGLVLARLFVDVGAWAPLSFLLPILAARAMFVRAQRVEVLARQLREREHLLEGLLDRAVDERRDERQRIGGELHDEVLQSLTSIRMLARVIEREATTAKSDSTIMVEDAQQLVRSADRTQQHLRAVIHDLQESPLGRGGLAPTLKRLVQDLRLEWRASIEIELFGHFDIASELQTVIYQVAREALLNALKHARARQISVRVERIDVVIVVVVDDDGMGFVEAAESTADHFGLGLMKERVDRVGGALEIVSRVGLGTTVRATFPIHETIAESVSTGSD